MSESTMTIDKFGTIHWRNSVGDLHRLDGPAVEYASGTKYWYQNGMRHRTDGPAIEWYEGTITWYYRGDCLCNDIKGFWALWDLLNEEERQNVDLHTWLIKLRSV